MQSRKLFYVVCALIVLFSLGALCQQPHPAVSQTEAAKAPSEKFIVYYFMTTMRCPSCHKIENWTHSTVTEKFAEEIKAGKIEWKIVNIDEKANEHFIKEYSIFTKTVIVSKIVDGKEVSWKNLDKVWQLLSNQDNFQKYIESELKAS